MKSMLIVSGIFMGTLLSLAYATEQNGFQSQAIPQQSVNSVPVAQGTELQGPEPRDDKGGHHHYHYSHGQELFTGDEWMLALPLLLIPIIAFGCWYFWGGSKDEGYGWDRDTVKAPIIQPRGLMKAECSVGRIPLIRERINGSSMQFSSRRI